MKRSVKIYFQLLEIFTFREIKSRYKASILGPFWIVIYPLMMNPAASCEVSVTSFKGTFVILNEVKNLASETSVKYASLDPSANRLRMTTRFSQQSCEELNH